MFCLHHLQWEQTVASLPILASRFPFTKPQPFSFQPVLMCGVIPPQAQNPKHFSLPNFRKFLLAQFHMSQSSSGLKLCHYINHFPLLSIIWNLLQGAPPLSHHPNQWWRHWKILDILDTPFVTGLQLDFKPLIMTHFSLASQPFFKHTHTLSTWK